MVRPKFNRHSMEAVPSGPSINNTNNKDLEEVDPDMASMKALRHSGYLEVDSSEQQNRHSRDQVWKLRRIERRRDLKEKATTVTDGIMENTTQKKNSEGRRNHLMVDLNHQEKNTVVEAAVKSLEEKSMAVEVGVEVSAVEMRVLEKLREKTIGVVIKKKEGRSLGSHRESSMVVVIRKKEGRRSSEKRDRRNRKRGEKNMKRSEKRGERRVVVVGSHKWAANLLCDVTLSVY
jgi:hypothetical protein